jgi:hypothetical protein
MEAVLEDELEGLSADGIHSGRESPFCTASASSAASSPTASRSMPAESRSILGRAIRTQSSIQSSSRTERPSHDGTAAAEKSSQNPPRDGEPDGHASRGLLLLKSAFRLSCGTKALVHHAQPLVSVTCQ